MRWCDVDLLADPPTVTITGTLIDHGRIAGKPLHRQEARKGDAPPHTVVLPRFGVESLTALVAESGMEGPVFANRGGGWMSLTNMRRALRAALPADLSWVTPHSFSAHGGHRGPRCHGRRAGAAAAVPREAGDDGGTLPAAADPRPGRARCARQIRRRRSWRLKVSGKCQIPGVSADFRT